MGRTYERIVSDQTAANLASRATGDVAPSRGKILLASGVLRSSPF